MSWSSWAEFNEQIPAELAEAWRQLDFDMTGQMERQEKTFLKMCSFVTLFLSVYVVHGFVP